MEYFHLGFGCVDMDCTAAVITHLSIHPVQFSVDFPSIISARSINGSSANYWQLLAAANSYELCLWQGLVFKLVWTEVTMKRALVYWYSLDIAL